VRRVVDQNVDPAEGLDGFVDELAAIGGPGHVSLDEHAGPPFGGHQPLGFTRLVCLRQVHHRDIRPFPGKRQRHRSADARIRPRNDSFLAF
jgi:hypothetical protein